MRPDHQPRVVGNSRPDHLYTHEWPSGEGRYLNFIIDEAGQPQAIDIELEPHARNRIKVTISFVHDRNNIVKVELKKFKLYKRKGWLPCPDDESGFGHQHITLRPYSFEKLLAFLQFVSGLDITGITQRRLALSIDGSQTLDDDTKRKLRTLLARKGGSELIAELLKTGLIATEDLVNLGYRKQQLALFERLLDDPASHRLSEGTSTPRRPARSSLAALLRAKRVDLWLRPRLPIRRNFAKPVSRLRHRRRRLTSCHQ